MQGVTSGSDALSLVKNTYFDLAILDAESSDVPFVPFTRELVAAQPGLKLLVFPPSNNPHHPVLAGLVANGFLKKPFFTPEVSRAFKEIFGEKTEDSPVEPQPITNLAELWMKRPEVGFNRVEQLLGSTTAKTGLLIGRGSVIAGSGPVEDATIQKVLALIDSHKPERATQDIMQFLSVDDGDEILVYASQLIPEITLVLFYPPSTSIQLARQEVFQVKNEFKEAYPNTSELRKELAINNGSQAAKGSAAPDFLSDFTGTGPTDLKPLEEEIGFEDLDTVLSSAELKSLDSMLAEMPPPDPGLEGEDEQVEPEPAEDLGLTDWLPLAEDHQEVESSSAQEAAGEKLDEPDTTEPELEIPPLPEELIKEFQEPSQDEAESQEAFPMENPDLAPVEASEDQIPEESIEKEPGTDEFNFDVIWDTQKEKSEIAPEFSSSVEETTTEESLTAPENLEAYPDESSPETTPPAPQEPEIVEEDVFNAWLDELSEKEPTSDKSDTAAELEESVLPPPLPVPEPASPVMENEELSTLEDTVSEIPKEAVEGESGLIPLVVESELAEAGDIETLETEKTIPDEAIGVPPPLPQGSFIEELSSTPEISPVGLNNFRFHYSCLVIPRDPNQFLTGDIKERLSFILPQLHLEYGWRLTGLVIRPQYLLWSISVPMDACPIDIIQEIRRRTSAHLFATFPELNPENNLTDFWAPGFLALSGSSGPSAGMMYDFINTTRDNQKPGN